jgi:hypothetical protein
LQPQGLREARAIVAKRTIAQFSRFVLGQCGDSVGQSSKLGDGGTTDQDWDNDNLARECSLDFVTYIITRLLLGSLVQDLCPSRSNHDQGDITTCKSVIYGPPKRISWRNVLDIHEDPVGSHQVVEVIAQTARVGGRVFPTIVDEDVARGRLLFEILTLALLLCRSRLCPKPQEGEPIVSSAEPVRAQDGVICPARSQHFPKADLSSDIFSDENNLFT